MKTSQRMISIAMIEDDYDLCMGWGDLFDMLGHGFTCFQTAQSFLAAKDCIETCDLIITDYYLPDLNGVEILKRIRQIRPSVPIIILTGSREIFIREAILDQENSYLMYKPLNIEDIEDKITEIFSSK